MQQDHPAVMTNSQRHEFQTKLLELSTNANHVIAEKSNHNVQATEPELIASAIEQVVESVTTGSSLSTVP